MTAISFGFLFAKVMREYNMEYSKVLALPITLFWFLYGQIDRLRAEDDLRRLNVAAASQSPEAAQSLSNGFRTQLDKVVKIDPVKAIMSERLDRAGFEALRTMGG